MSLLKRVFMGLSLLCGGCEDQTVMKKQTAEITQLQEEKRLLETEREGHNQSLAGCKEKLRKAEADIKNLKETLNQKKAAEGKSMEKKPNVKHKKKGQR